MGYAEIVKAQQKRDGKKALPKGGSRGKRKRKTTLLVVTGSASVQSKELEQDKREIETSGSRGLCSVLRFTCSRYRWLFARAD